MSGVTAGLTQGVFDGVLKTQTNPVTGKVTVDLGSVDGIGRFAANQMLQGATSAALGRALGLDTSMEGALQSALLNTVAAGSFNAVGDLGLQTGSAEKVLLHGFVGGLLAEAAGGDFVTGAVAAGANEALANHLRQLTNQLAPENRDALLTASSQLVGVIAAATVDRGQDGAGSLETGAWVTKNATQYNFLNHSDTRGFVGDMHGCGANTKCQENVWNANGYNRISQENLAEAIATGGPAWAKDQLGQIAAGLSALEALNCTTSACESYKFTLIDRALKSTVELNEVVGQWEPVLGAIAGVAAGVAGSRPFRPAGTDTIIGSAQVNKAYWYWAGVKAGASASTGKTVITKAGIPLEYAPRIRQRATEDPGGHNFPFSFDETILSTKPVAVRGGGEGYAIRGYKNNSEVVFNIIVKNGQIVHRDLVSTAKWAQRSKSFGWAQKLEDIPRATQ